ncbi:MAG: sugar ABC transporter substrate-binding protein, partial [Lachnospiraceae bacterium]|nr:sugar ABC transporter substrate-binding protein [Lachnospiraceae bacterium]
MKKKLVAGLMSATMAMTLLAGCGSTAEAPAADAPAAEEAAPAAEETPAAEEAAEEITDYGTGDIKVWVAENTVEFTQNKIKEWQDANPQFAGYTVTVEPVGEGDAAGNMITDVEAGADIYAFAQDQIARLVTAGA